MEAIGSVPLGESTELITVVDHNPALFDRLNNAGLPVRVVENVNVQGISGARNTGTKHARGDIVVFLDDDALGRPGWLALLLAAFEDPAVVVAGGSLYPRWEKGPATWHPESFYWIFGCSWLGLPTRTATVRNVIGACMAIKRSALEALGGFREALGRSGPVPLGCDETDLCVRAAALGTVTYLPECKVDHFVPAERTSLRYFILRCWSEGSSKAVLATLVGTRHALSEEVNHLRVMAREGLGSLRAGDLRRAGAIVLGTATTFLGYTWGRAALLHGPGARAQGTGEPA
jgi:hypothetical protein